MKWLLLALLLASCSSISAGKVVSRDFTPAHEESYLATEYGCGFGYGYGFDGKYTYSYGCGRMIQVQRQRTVPDAWSLTLEAVNPDNGNAEQRTIEVGQEVYDATATGDWYEVPQ